LGGEGKVNMSQSHIFSVQGKNEIHYRSQVAIVWISSYVLFSKQTHKELKSTYWNFLNRCINIICTACNSSHLPFHKKRLWACGFYKHVYWWATGSCSNTKNKSIRKWNLEPVLVNIITSALLTFL